MTDALPTIPSPHLTARRVAAVVGAWLVLGAVLAPGAGASLWPAIVPDARSTDSLITPLDVQARRAGSPVAVGGLSNLGVAITPDGSTAYVAGAGNGSLTPIDLRANPPRARPAIALTTTPAARVPRVPEYVAISPDGLRVYVTDAANDQLVVVDLSGPRPVVGRAIKVGHEPAGVAFAPDGRTAYVTNVGGRSVTPIAVATGRAGKAIRGVGKAPSQIAIAPDGRTAYVTDNGSDKLYPITLASRKIGAPIAVGSGPIGVAITPDGRTAYVADFGLASHFNGTGTTVTPVALATRTPLAPITVGGGPWALAITPDGRTVYVTDSNDQTVTPIDTAANTAGPPIAGFTSPRGIAIAPDQAPVAALHVVGAAAPGAAVQFSATGSSVAFGAIVSYRWSFGDGSPDVVTALPATSHVYAAPGLFTASVTETDSAGTSVPAVAFAGPTALAFTGQTAGARSSGAASASATFAVGSGAVAPPVVGKTVVARASGGTVLVRRRGSRRFGALRSPADVPTGSEFDTTRGSVTITVARGSRGETNAAIVSGGRFVTTQSRGARPATTFALSAPLACGASRGHRARARVRAVSARARSGRRRRSISVKEGSGSFKTKGHYVAASVQGTRWTTTDSCTSSTVSVRSGLVAVTDLVRHRTTTLGPGEHYTAHRR